LKVDYDIGAFENASGVIEPAMDGLSLSMVSLGSMFRVLAGTRRVSNTVISNENATNVNTGSSGTTRIAKIRFGSGSSLAGRVFESDLSSIPYTIGVTPYAATGQIIPVLMGGIALGKSNQVGNYTQQSGVAIVGMVYLYSVNFPTWSGQALVHDPVFSTFVSSGSSGPGLWLYIGIALGGVAALVVVLAVVHAKKKRASSYPGMPRAAPGEAKARPGAPRVDLLHSFFFHGDGPGDTEGGMNEQLDPYDPATFEFFAALVATRIQELEPSTNAWAMISARDIEVVPGVSTADIARVMGSEIVISSDKYALDTDTGRAYVYEVTLGNDTTLQLLDIFTRPAADTILRISLCSRQALATAAYPAIENAMRRLPMSLKRAAAGKFHKDMFESVIDGHLPVHLASPRRFTTSDVSGFLREARQDGRLTPDDLAEIEADLRKMDDATAKRVSGTYKASAARDEMDAGAPGEPGR
jgi:hypothetical protein